MGLHICDRCGCDGPSCFKSCALNPAPHGGDPTVNGRCNPHSSHSAERFWGGRLIRSMGYVHGVIGCVIGGCRTSCIFARELVCWFVQIGTPVLPKLSGNELPPPAAYAIPALPCLELGSFIVTVQPIIELQAFAQAGRLPASSRCGLRGVGDIRFGRSRKGCLHG